jgi:5'-nucleotidase
VMVAVLALAGCSSDGGDDAAAGTAAPTAAPVTDAPSSTTASTSAPAATEAPTTMAPTTVAVTEAPSTTEAVEPLTILVTNDDGIGAPGIDALVMALQDLPDVEVVVVAPAGNQSGSSDKTTPGELVTSASATASGMEGTAVEGFPADSVNVALDVLGIEPDVVVSGVNTGQNIGTFVPLSGTVGAARTAARRGIPAIAVSAGGLEGSDYATAATLAAAEVTARRASFGFGSNADSTVVNLNVPTCAEGTQVRGVVDVPVATVFPEGTDGINMPFDCASTATDPTDDAIALMIGYAARTIVPADL